MLWTLLFQFVVALFVIFIRELPVSSVAFFAVPTGGGIPFWHKQDGCKKFGNYSFSFSHACRREDSHPWHIEAQSSCTSCWSVYPNVLLKGKCLTSEVYYLIVTNMAASSEYYWSLRVKACLEFILLVAIRYIKVILLQHPFKPSTVDVILVGYNSCYACTCITL